MKELFREVDVQRKDDIAIRQVLLKKKGGMMERKDFELQRPGFKFQLLFL